MPTLEELTITEDAIEKLIKLKKIDIKSTDFTLLMKDPDAQNNPVYSINALQTKPLSGFINFIKVV